MLHPLGMMAVIAVVFSHVMSLPVKDYAVFLFAGLLPWNYFNSTVMMSLGNIRANARLFAQVPIPRYMPIVSVAMSNLVNFCLAIVPLMVIMVFTGRAVPATALFFPVVILPLFCVVLGVSLILSVSSVFFDDTLHLAEVAMQAFYFLCPILYRREMLPQRLIRYLVLNPLFGEIEFIRGLFYEGVLPGAIPFALNCAASLFILSIGLFVFTKAQNKLLYFI